MDTKHKIKRNFSNTPCRWTPELNPFIETELEKIKSKTKPINNKTAKPKKYSTPNLTLKKITSEPKIQTRKKYIQKLSVYTPQIPILFPPIRTKLKELKNFYYQKKRSSSKSKSFLEESLIIKNVPWSPYYSSDCSKSQVINRNNCKKFKFF